MTNPDIPSDSIAKHYDRFRKNRDFVSGEYDVKRAGILYLPKLTEQADAQYDAYKLRAEFYPAASRTLDGLRGLVFRKAPVLDASAEMKAVCDSITVDGGSVYDLATFAFDETATVNFGGLWIDYPTKAAEVATRLQEAATGDHPYIQHVPAEDVLEISKAVIGGRRVLNYVRIRIDCDTIRELALMGGVYTVTEWTKVGDNWIPAAPFSPTKGGRPFGAIPFVPLGTSAEAIAPKAAMIDNVVSLNHNHYLASADLSNLIYWASNPIVWAAGVAEGTELSLVAGTYHVFDKPDAKVSIEQFDSAAVPMIEERLANIEEHMASTGARILASEKAASEAAETLAIRRAGENSILAAHANMISRKITEALSWVSLWIDGGDVSYQLNTDYDPSMMVAGDLAAFIAAYQSGVFPLECIYEAALDGELIRPNVTFEEFKSRLEQDEADKPKAAPAPNPLTGFVDRANTTGENDPK